jgi:hypothetical protein
MSLKDYVRVSDAGLIRTVGHKTVLSDPSLLEKYFAAEHEWGNEDQPVVQVEGWVKTLMRERGKIVRGSFREGHNIWTNTGREYLALLMSIQTGPSTGFRSDKIAYIGVGTGARVEDAGVTSLLTPAAYATGQFLASLDIPPTFPLTPTRTTVRYHRIFAEDEITLSIGSTVNLSEFGLFTNGRQSDYAVGLRDTTLAGAASQSPAAYKSLEPIGKKDSLQLEVSWEIRF